MVCMSQGISLLWCLDNPAGRYITTTFIFCFQDCQVQIGLGLCSLRVQLLALCLEPLSGDRSPTHGVVPEVAIANPKVKTLGMQSLPVPTFWCLRCSLAIVWQQCQCPYTQISVLHFLSGVQALCLFPCAQTRDMTLCVAQFSRHTWSDLIFSVVRLDRDQLPCAVLVLSLAHSHRFFTSSTALPSFFKLSPSQANLLESQVLGQEAPRDLNLDL